MGREETTTSEYHERSAERAAAAMTKKTGLGAKMMVGSRIKRARKRRRRLKLKRVAVEVGRRITLRLEMGSDLI
jgi:hypothetical protein